MQIGLKKLTEISRGSVRIEKNPALCYTTLDWDLIVSAGENVIKDNGEEASCPGIYRLISRLILLSFQLMKISLSRISCYEHAVLIIKGLMIKMIRVHVLFYFGKMEECSNIFNRCLIHRHFFKQNIRIIGT